MSTDTDVRPRTADSDTDDVVFHYVDKTAITESAVMGNEVTALCGYKFPVTRTPKPGAAICGECKAIYNALPG